MKKACLISVVCLLFASLALAQTKQGRTKPNALKGAPTTCGADPVLASDGTVTSEDFIAVFSTAYYQLNVKGGHSYSIEVWDPFDPTAMRCANDPTARDRLHNGDILYGCNQCGS